MGEILRRIRIGTEVPELPVRNSHEDLRMKLAVEVELMMHAEEFKDKGDANVIQQLWTQKYGDTFRKWWNNDGYREMVYMEWEADRSYLLDKIQADLERAVTPSEKKERPAAW
jgi:hypothetical protein